MAEQQSTAGFNFNFDPVSWFDDGSDTATNDRRFMNDWNMKMQERNEAFQRELAEHGIKMRVNDAIDAGLHPLVGAGVNPASGQFGSPIFAGDAAPAGRSGSTSMGFSQNIGRARSATMTLEERMESTARLENIRANTAESMARKALAEYELQKLKGPVMPDPMSVRRDPVTHTNDVFEHNLNQIFGPPSHAFWGTTKRLLRPFKKLDYRTWRD